MSIPHIVLYELEQTRSARCRWTLLEAGLKFVSRGNNQEVFNNQELKGIHPLRKLPAALIDGEPLFESAAICTAIADLVPDQGLIAKPGSLGRALHDQWVSFALTEMEAWLWSTEINTDKVGFLLPLDDQVPQIRNQCLHLFQRSAKVLDQHLATTDYLIENRFSVTDVIVSYTIAWAEEWEWITDMPNLLAYTHRLRKRKHCTLPNPT